MKPAIDKAIPTATTTVVSQVGSAEVPKEEVSPIENLTTFTLRGGRAEDKVSNESVETLPQVDKVPAGGTSDKAQLLDQPLPASPRSKGCWVIFYTWLCTLMLAFIRTIQEGAGEVPRSPEPKTGSRAGAPDNWKQMSEVQQAKPGSKEK